MFYKNQYHEELYNQFTSILNNDDTYYKSFAFVAAAIEKKGILNALDEFNIDKDLLLDMSKAWLNSERAMLEIAWQLFNDVNLYEIEGEIQFPIIKSIFNSLDSENLKVVIEAIGMKYF